jgi:hypothetical protein
MAAKVQIGAEFDGKDAQNGIKQLDNALDKVGATAEDAGKGFQIAGLSLTDLQSGLEMASQVLGPVVDGMKATIDAASDMNETISKSQVVFGDAAAAVEAMGNTAATSMGISKQEAIAAAATYGNLMVSMGLSKDAAADMSINLVKLAGDFASFNNIPVAEALEKIRAGLVGEGEPMKTLGVIINETTLKQEAMNLGLSNGKDVLDAGTKAQAAYSLMLKQSTTAQGDYIRTADGAANQTKTLEAQTKDLEAAIGKGLLPAYKELLSALNSIIKTTAELVGHYDKISASAKKHSLEVAKLVTTYAGYRAEMEAYAKTNGLAISATGELTQTVIGANGAVTQMGTGVYIAAQFFSKFTDEGTRAATAAQLFARDTDAVTAAHVQAEPTIESLTEALEREAGAFMDTGSAANELNKKMAAIKLGASLTSSTEAYRKKQEELNQEIWVTEQSIAKLGDLKILTPNQLYELNQFWTGLQIAAKAAKNTGGGVDEMNAAIQKVSTSIPIFTSAKDAVSYLQGEVNKLSGGTYLTPAQQDQLIALRTELGKQQQAVKDLDAEHLAQTKNMLWNLMVQKAAALGMTDTVIANLLKLGQSWGILTDESYTAAEQINKIDLTDATLEVQDFNNALFQTAGLPRTLDFFINTYKTTYNNDEEGRYEEVKYNSTPTPSPTTTPGRGGKVGAQSEGLNEAMIARLITGGILTAVQR